MKIKHQDSILHPAIMMIAMNKNTTSTKNINNIETSSDSEQENDLVEYHNLQSVKSKQNKFKNHEYNSFKLNKGRPPMFPKINNQKFSNTDKRVGDDMKNRYKSYSEGTNKTINLSKNLTKTSDKSELNAQFLAPKKNQKLDKRNSILMTSIQLIAQKNERRSSLLNISRNVSAPYLVSVSTKESSNFSQNQKYDSDNKIKAGLLNSKLFQALIKDSESDPSNEYKIVVTQASEAQNYADKYSRTPLRRMNLKLYPRTISIKRISTRAHIRLEKERLASKPKMDFLKLPTNDSMNLPDIYL